MPVTAEVFRVSPTPTPAINTEFNETIDFCVWILERDGLRVSPFDTHPQSIGALQRQGLTPQLWQAWFDRIVRLQHSLLEWEGWYTPRSDWIENQVSICQGMAERLQRSPEWDSSEIDWGANRATLGHHYDLDQAQAEIAAQEAGLSSPLTPPFPGDLLSSDFLPKQAAPELKRSLEALWHQYEETEVLPRLQQHGYPERMLSSQTKSAFTAQLPLPRLNFYLVTYATPIRVIVPSCSIVTSTLPELDSEAFRAFVLDAVAMLS